MFNEEFWVAISFIIVTILIYNPAKLFISRILDDKKTQIKLNLENAEKLREEAENVFKSYSEMRQRVLQEAEEIVKHAEKRVIIMIEDAKDNLNKTLEKKKISSMQKISSYESKIINDLREESVTIAINVVQKLLRERLIKKASDPIMFEAMDEISKKLH